MSEWADKYRTLSPEASADPVAWDTDRTPYMREPMNSVLDHETSEIVLMMASQVGKTECILNMFGYYIDQDPSPVLVVLPTLELAGAFSKDRLAPMLRDSAVLFDLVKNPRTRDSDNTILHKKFPGGHITLAGANSPASLSHRPIRILLCDEVDRYEASAGTEGDPISLARKRATTFWNRKIILASTPTRKGESRIEAAYDASDKRKYMVPCPDCKHLQILKWGGVDCTFGLKWVFDEKTGHQPETATYMCEHCHSLIPETKKLWMIKRGQWKAEREFHGIAGFQISEIYSPWVRWSEMVSSFLQLKKFPDTLRTFVNLALGETFEEKGETVSENPLMERREDYGADLLPMGVLVLTAGVDIQKERIEVEVIGWGNDQESWGIEEKIIYGDPAQTQVWTDLDEYLKSSYLHESGVRMRIAAVGVDTGGHHTQEVYSFCKKRFSRRIFAVKGIWGEGRPIVTRPSRNNAQRVPLFMIGVDTAKERLYARLKIERLESQRDEPCPGFCHFPVTYQEEYFKQLTSEKVVPKYLQGRVVRVWKKKNPNARNEALDRRNYAMAALELIGTDMKNRAARIQAAIKVLEARKNPSKNPENTTGENEQVLPENKKQSWIFKKRRGFTNSWKE